MRLWDYVRDKAALLLLNLAGVFFLSLFLKLEEIGSADLCIIGAVWILVLVVWMLLDYRRQKHLFAQLFLQLEELEKPYLIAEVMDASPHLQDRLYREILRISNRSVIEKIHELEDAGRDYKEYIESWVHEVKLPLTAAKLMCENFSGESRRQFLLQMDRIEKQVEQVLFYARMEHVYQDYLIHRVNLRKMVLASIAENKVYFIQRGIQIELELALEEEICVSTDEKWTIFLLNQIFSNAVKYCREEHPMVRVYAKRGDRQVSLIIEDNGVGIAKEDLGRIFEKGFTGQNGRDQKHGGGQQKSTGIGLYLCRGLCQKLGLGIACESKEGEYTRMILTFPEANSFENVR